MPAHARHADDSAPKHARHASSSAPRHARHASSTASASAKHGKHAAHAAAHAKADGNSQAIKKESSPTSTKKSPALLIGCGVLVLALAGGTAVMMQPRQEEPAKTTTEVTSTKTTGSTAKKTSSPADPLRKKTFYLTQSMHGRCTITSCAMLLRRKSYLDGNKNWANIVEDSLYEDAWVWGTGIKHNFDSQGYRVRSFTWKANPDPKDRTQRLVRLLEKHPEGIVIYDEYVPHAIVLTRYEEKTDTFYCADPAGGSYSGKEIKLVKSWNGTVRGSQSNVICSLNRSWYVAGKTKPAGKKKSKKAADAKKPDKGTSSSASTSQNT